MPQANTQNGWWVPETKEGNFEKFGHPEFTFSGIDINSLLYGEFEELMDLRDEAAGEDKAAGPFLKELTRRLVVGWNLTDPKTGAKLPPPAEDPESIRRLPINFITHMVETVMGVSAEAVPPANGS